MRFWGELWKGRVRNIYFAIWLFAGTFPGSAKATSVVVAVTPDRIVVGADGKVLGSLATALKIVLLKHRLTVASLAIERKELPDGKVVYDFLTWIGEIDKQTHSNLSVTELTRIIKERCPKAFAFFNDYLGTHTEDQARKMGLGPIAVKYVIAGFENGVPLVRDVTLIIDWQTHTLRSPVEFLLYPEEAHGLHHPYVDLFSGSHDLSGSHGMELAMSVADSKERKELIARVPVEFQIMGNHGEFTGNQASNAIRALLCIDAEAAPTEVGFPLTIVTIPRVGQGWVRTYKQDVFTLSRLPRGKPKEKQDNVRKR
jgi:hypothetical protein